ncbi:MAG: cyclic nucleotide-binding domain-containing protein [Polyangiales bacterium]|nr:cyclic nucleotide-binding domain-containing protein [Myxococcales bacterium]MCB9602295.1 cyclic nucleotide-binding domain-containing protein [Sandaracinus sp.]
MSRTAKLRDQLQAALRKERFQVALGVYDELSEAEPTEPRWPHRKGDLLRRLNDDPGAVRAFEKAVDLYAGQGFVARAAALAKVILQIDPHRRDILERVDPEAAQRLHREARRSTLDEERTLQQAAAALERTDDDDDFLEIDEEAAIEIRLTDAELAPPPLPPRTSIIELDPSELDVLEDDVLFFDVEEEPRRRTAEDLAALPATPLLAELPKSVLQRLLGEAELLELEAGKLLIEVGQPSDALFLLVEGGVAVHVPGSTEAPIELGEGELVGESCLLDEVSRRADVVVAPGGLSALRIAKTTLDALVEEHPPLHDLLLELLGRRLLANLLLTSPVFAGFDADTKRELAALFQLRSAARDTRLVERGKRGDGLYCVLLGALEARGEASRRLGPGTVLGQRSLITRQPSSVDVVCATDTLLLRLPAARFNELAATYPPVLMYLSELAAGPIDDAIG